MTANESEEVRRHRHNRIGTKTISAVLKDAEVRLGGEQLRQARQRCAGDIEHDGEWFVCIRSTRTFIDRDPDQDALNS
jgi:hypothetical protein